MHYTGQVYRPPFEAHSLLLEVTTGCSHNACSFCTMYRDTPFSVAPMEQIEEDLQEASEYADSVQRVFLVNGDAFALSADKLKIVAEKIRHYLPKVETIAMYASILNVKGKTEEQLKELRALGVNELNMGIESGYDDALRYMNKKYTAEEALLELLKLRGAGIDYGANIILGAAGREKSIEHALATAELLNQTQPYLIFSGTIHADLGCQLYDDLVTGAFEEPTVGEYVEEERTLIEALDLEDGFFFGLHPSNVVRMQGNLPDDKEQLLHTLKAYKETMGERVLQMTPLHGAEGSIYLRERAPYSCFSDNVWRRTKT